MTVADTHPNPVLPAQSAVANLANPSMEEEVSAMVRALNELDGVTPDIYIETCMSYMARCTEMLIHVRKLEGKQRQYKVFRITQLEPLMELIEFLFKGSSRLVEVRRQEIELSR